MDDGTERPAKGGWRARVPNALTLARVGLAVLCFVGMGLAEARQGEGDARESFQGNGWLIASLVLFVLAAATDAVDGHLARRWKVVSRFGRVMDPFADKLLVLGAFVLMAHPRFWVGMHVPVWGMELAGIQGWMAVVVLGRELLVTSLRGVFEADGVDFSATASGKWKMVLQCVCVPLALLVLVTQGNPVPRGIAGGLTAVVWATVVVTVVSGVPYGVRAMRGKQGVEA